MKVLIIEDEAVIAARLQKQIGRIRPDAQVVGIANDIPEGRLLLSGNPDVDIVFSDIRLSDGFSFSIFDSVESDAFIVFTTAYDEYALKAFDYNCLDYLVKPVRDKDLEDAFLRFEHNLLSTRARQITSPLPGESAEEMYRRRLKIKCGKTSIIVPVGEICYIEYSYEMTNVHLADGTRGIVEMSLGSLAASLDPREFFRANRQYVVGINMVKSLSSTIGRGKILSLREPYPDVRIKMSSSSAKELMKILGL
ncbi:MAG: response regulator transcription factor [Bacteroidales bacterium]|nr:response regulator transcription factor [Bacteroidales bacterium]MBQ9174106.1 response regulator transcription factor [Bacteroidales bacterium]MBQ9711304.1 response regulator transcription factor [Bacteroidales bacterium]